MDSSFWIDTINLSISRVVRLYFFFKYVALLSEDLFTFTNSVEVSKGAKIRNRYNQVPHLTQDTNGKCGTRHRGYPGTGPC